MYYLYKITSPNNKFYIGVTNNPKRRWKSHCSSPPYRSAVSSTIKKYGKSNMKFEILNQFETLQEALKAEASIVTSEFICRKDTLNLVVGGGNPPVTKSFSKLIEINGVQYSSIKEAAEKLGYETRHPLDRLIKLNLIEYKFLEKEPVEKTNTANKPYISKNESRIIIFEGHTFHTYKEIYKEFNLSKDLFLKAKRELKRDPINIDEVNSFKTIKTPIEINGVWFSSKAEAIKEKVITSYKLNVWTKKGTPLENQKKVKVNMICLSTNKVIKTFNSLTEAANYVKAPNPSKICMCVKNKRNTAYGYKWESVK